MAEFHAVILAAPPVSDCIPAAAVRMMGMIRSCCRFLAWLFLLTAPLMVIGVVCSARGINLHSRLEIGELVQLNSRNRVDRTPLLIAAPAIAAASVAVLRLTDRP